MVKKQKGKCDDKLKRNCHKKDGCEWTPGTTRNGKRVKGRCNEMETQPEVDDILQSIQDETQELEDFGFDSIPSVAEADRKPLGSMLPQSIMATGQELLKSDDGY